MQSPLRRFDKELKTLLQYNARQNIEHPVMTMSARAQFVIGSIENIIAGDISSRTAIRSVQMELAELLAYIAYRLARGGQRADHGREMPTRHTIRHFVVRFSSGLIYEFMALPYYDRVAASKFADSHVRPMLRCAIKILRPLTEPQIGETL